jgi:hypothetical protein
MMIGGQARPPVRLGFSGKSASSSSNVLRMDAIIEDYGRRSLMIDDAQGTCLLVPAVLGHGSGK